MHLVVATQAGVSGACGSGEVALAACARGRMGSGDVEPPRARGRKGMTLIELMIAMAIFGISVLTCLSVLTSSVDRNRSTRLTVASTMATRETVEETMVMADAMSIGVVSAPDAAGSPSLMKPMALCRYLLSRHLDEGFKVTKTGNPLQQIVCKFPAMTPGESSRTPEGLKPFMDGNAGLSGGAGGTLLVAEATMTVYLDESKVPVQLGGAVEAMWRDLAQGSSAEGLNGFDINGDGVIQSGGMITDSSNPKFAINGVSGRYQRLSQLPVDVELVYYYQTRSGDDTDNSGARQTHVYRTILTDAD